MHSHKLSPSKTTHHKSVSPLQMHFSTSGRQQLLSSLRPGSHTLKGAPTGLPPLLGVIVPAASRKERAQTTVSSTMTKAAPEMAAEAGVTTWGTASITATVLEMRLR